MVDDETVAAQVGMVGMVGVAVRGGNLVCNVVPSCISLALGDV
jgi:hypothetical protein